MCELPSLSPHSLVRPTFSSSPSHGHQCRAVARLARFTTFHSHSLPLHNRLFVRNPAVWKALGLAGCTGSAAFALHAWSKPAIQCQGSPSATPEQLPQQSTPPPIPPPASTKPFIDVYELSFGTVAGICTGVFVKKGLKTVAFFLGGFFVLIQAFNSLRIFHIDLGALSRPFEKLFYREDTYGGQRRPPTITTFWSWLVNFLTADFPPRASFLAGLVLGLRIG